VLDPVIDLFERLGVEVVDVFAPALLDADEFGAAQDP
jgi:hypothetical protein